MSLCKYKSSRALMPKDYFSHVARKRMYIDELRYRLPRLVTLRAFEAAAWRSPGLDRRRRSVPDARLHAAVRHSAGAAGVYPTLSGRENPHH